MGLVLAAWGSPPIQLDGPPADVGGDRHHRATFGAVGGDDRVRGSAGGEDGVQSPQDRGGDHGLGWGDGELVLLSGSQTGEPGGV
jgi:hypothetical protein